MGALLAILNSEFITRHRTVATISNGRKGEFGGHPTASVAGRPTTAGHGPEITVPKPPFVTHFKATLSAGAALGTVLWSAMMQHSANECCGTCHEHKIGWKEVTHR